MAQKEVTYTSSSKLSCADCLPANVILCVPASLIAPVLCPDQESDETYEYRHIEARILSVCTAVNCGLTASYTYTIDYNEELLLDDYDLRSRDIQGIFCKGCLTNWVEDLVGNEPTLTQEGNTVTFVSPHGCISTINITDVDDLIPSADCTYDIGSEDLQWEDLYICGTAHIDTAIIDSLTVEGDVVFGTSLLPGSDCFYDLGSALQQWNDLFLCGDATIGGEVILTASLIRTNTVDGTDDHFISIAGGAAASSTRGAYLTVYGNEAVGQTGNARVKSGDAAGSSVALIGGSTTSDILLSAGVSGTTKFQANSVTFWQVTATGLIEQDATNGGDIVFNKAAGLIRHASGDTDTKSTAIAGGGTASYLRGSSVTTHGISHATFPGGLLLQGGDSVTGHVDSILGNGSALFRWISAGGTTRWTMDSGGTLLPFAVGAYDIGSVTNSVRVLYTDRVQGRTANNLELAARNGSIYFYTIAADATPLSRWRIASSTGNIEQDATNGGAIIMGRTGSNSGVILVGTPTLDTDITSLTGTHYGLAISQDRGAVSDHLLLIGYGANTSGATLDFFKTRSTSATGDANTIVANGDIIGILNFRMADGAAYLNAAAITVLVDGAPSLNDAPGKIRFSTTADGSASPVTRWEINALGQISQDATNGSDVVLTKASTSVRQTVVTGITAAGTISSDATALTGIINNVTTVAAGTGVRAWSAGVGSVLHVRNGGANALLVYPNTGGTINGAGVDAGVSVAVGAIATLMVTAASTWIASEAPAA